MITEPSIKAWKALYEKPLAQFHKNEVVANNIVRRLRMDDTLEMTEQIRALKETAQYLNERIDQLEQKLGYKKEVEFKLWEPAYEEKHYYVNSLGCWELGKRTYAFDDRRISNFNCYKTQEIAQQEAKWLRAARKLRALARELNGSDDPLDYSIVRCDDGEYSTIYVPRGPKLIGTVYFDSEEVAQTALDQLTEDEREVLFGN